MDDSFPAGGDSVAAGEPLAALLGAPMEVGTFLRIAVGMASAVSKVHQAGLVHKDIKPANVLITGAGSQAHLTGFDIASHLTRERQSPEPPELIAGTLSHRQTCACSLRAGQGCAAARLGDHHEAPRQNGRGSLPDRGRA